LIDVVLWFIQRVTVKRYISRATPSAANVSALLGLKDNSAKNACHPTTTGTSHVAVRYYRSCYHSRNVSHFGLSVYYLH